MSTSPCGNLTGGVGRLTIDRTSGSAADSGATVDHPNAAVSKKYKDDCRIDMARVLCASDCGGISQSVPNNCFGHPRGRKQRKPEQTARQDWNGPAGGGQVPAIARVDSLASDGDEDNKVLLMS
jgi:hypothetical protein